MLNRILVALGVVVIVSALGKKIVNIAAFTNYETATRIYLYIIFLLYAIILIAYYIKPLLFLCVNLCLP